MGRTRALLGDYAGANRRAGGELRRSLQTDDRWTASNGMMNLGEVYLKQGDHERADALRQALDMRRALANPVGAAQALNLLGALYLAGDLLDQAEASYREAESLLGAGTQGRRCSTPGPGGRRSRCGAATWRRCGSAWTSSGAAGRQRRHWRVVLEHSDQPAVSHAGALGDARADES